MRSAFRGSVLLIATFFVPLSATAQPSRTETTFSKVLKQWSELSLEGQGRPVQGLRLSSGHVTLVLTQGNAAPVLAGDEVVGVFFRGQGTLEYVSADPVEFPIVTYNVRKNTNLALTSSEKALTIRDTFEEVLWLAGGVALPTLPEGSSKTALEDAFAKHLRKFGQIMTSPVAHEFPAWRLNSPDRSLVRVELSGGSEDLLYHLDAFDDKSETLWALRKAKKIEDRLYCTVLSDQSVGRDRREPLVPRFMLTDVDLSVTASSGKDVSISVTENFTAVGGRVRVLQLDLYDTIFGRDALDPRHLRVKGVFDEAGNALPFDHAKDELIVGLTTPLAPGATTKVRFEIEGDILYHPGGDSYWELGVYPWFPQPDLSGQFYTVHSTVKVKRPFVPFAPGKTLRRTVEGDYNILETRIDKPVQFMVIIAGNYAFNEETKNGVTVRVATYAGKSANLGRVLGLAQKMIAFYEPFLGPFPFDEFNIVEINAWGFGQAPPAFMFITQEAFKPLAGEINRLFSKGINERLAHEIAHQYWGFDTVIDDGDYFHWPGLPLGIYTDQLYMAQRAKLRFGTGQYRAAVSKGLDTTIRRTARQMEANRFDWGGIVCHEKAYAVVRMLADMMGPDRFVQFLRSLQDRYRYQFLSFDDFQAAAEAAAGRKLDWFFHDWVDTNGVAGYAIESVEAHDGRIPVRIRQTGTARFPVEVSLTTEDGVRSVQRIAPEPDTGTLDFAAAGQPRRVEIDPRGVCPLRKTGKEIWTML